MSQCNWIHYLICCQRKRNSVPTLRDFYRPRMRMSRQTSVCSSGHKSYRHLQPVAPAENSTCPSVAKTLAFLRTLSRVMEDVICFRQFHTCVWILVTLHLPSPSLPSFSSRPIPIAPFPSQVTFSFAFSLAIGLELSFRAWSESVRQPTEAINIPSTGPCQQEIVIHSLYLFVLSPPATVLMDLLALCMGEMGALAGVLCWHHRLLMCPRLSPTPYYLPQCPQRAVKDAFFLILSEIISYFRRQS